ncbi:MAG TPA: hypothetical protein VE685_15795 [Thermoanaerobaculia bacterium]|nr:hypothetical protein [Thermoanaerobaculia bacterium]
MSGIAAPVATVTSVAIDAAQQEVLLAELAALAGSVHDPVARVRCEELTAAVAEGAVEEDLLSFFESVLEMSLQTGRARRVHGPESEQALLRLFQQTPRGGAARRATEAVNKALAALAGQTIEKMLFTIQGPGVFRLGVETDGCKLTLEIDRHCVSVESLEV